MALRETKRHIKNKSQGSSRKLNGGYAVDNDRGETRYYDNQGHQTGSSGVDKSSSAYRMCGGQDD